MFFNSSSFVAPVAFVEWIHGTQWIRFSGYQTPGTAVWDEEDRRYAYIVKPDGTQKRFYEADYLEEQASIAASETDYHMSDRDREDFIERYIEQHTGAST
jgi:hypothetical protein